MLGEEHGRALEHLSGRYDLGFCWFGEGPRSDAVLVGDCHAAEADRSIVLRAG
jgi:hypothetical protein